MRRMASRWYAFVLGVTVSLVCSATPAPLLAAPNDAAKFKPGDRIVQEWAGEKLTGKVLSVDLRSGWLEIEYDDKKRYPRPWKQPARNIQKVSGKSAVKTGGVPGTAKAKSSSGENPFETVEERANKNGPRTWTDLSGKHQIEASLVKVDGDTVTLKRKDGKEVAFALTRLSEADQKFLKDIRGEETPGAAEASDAVEADEEFPAAEVAIGDIQAIDVGPAEWTYQEDAFSSAPLGDIRIGLGEKHFFEHVSTVLYSADKSKAAVIWSNQHDKASRVQVCDLKSRKVESNGPFAAGKVPVAMSPDMSRVAAVEEDWSSRATIYVYEIHGTSIKPLVCWKSSEGQHGHEPKIETARFLDNDRLLTANSEGHVVLWNLKEKVQGDYQIVKAGSGQLALSATGKYFAVPAEDGIVLIETQTGKNAGMIKADELFHATLAFDAAGKQLAVASAGRIRVWDLTTRKLVNDFVTEHFGANRLSWVGENTLLSDAAVIDVPHRVCLWTYRGGPSGFAGTTVGGRFLCAGGTQNPSLIAAKIPSDEALELIKGQKPDDLLRIKPGDTVTLDVQLGAYSQHQAKVIEDLTRQLKANGMQVGPDGKARLVVSVQPGEVKTLEYRTIGRGFGTQSVSVPTQVTSLLWTVDGKEIWKRGGTIAPGFVTSKKDESMDAAIQRQISDSIAGLGNTRLPRYVAALPDGKSPGTSISP